MERVALSRLRSIKLPAPKEKEEDRIVALRKTLEFHKDSPDSLVLCVDDSIADLITDEKPATAKDATLKS